MLLCLWNDGHIKKCSVWYMALHYPGVLCPDSVAIIIIKNYWQCSIAEQALKQSRGQSGTKGQSTPRAGCSLKTVGVALPSVLTCQSQRRGFLLHLPLEPPAQAGGNKLWSPEKEWRDCNFKTEGLVTHSTWQPSPTNKQCISYSCHSGIQQLAKLETFTH